MNKFLAVMLVSALAVPVFSGGGKKEAKAGGYKVIEVNELASALKSENKPLVFDANGKDTREKFGVVPGAILLENYKKYDAKKVLPADKTTPIVFYCGSTACMAAPDAAKRAVKAGYKNVMVMAAGIKGWKEAGQPVTQTKTTEPKK